MDNTPSNAIFREPFDLRLEIDGVHFYEEHFARIPYVYDDTIFLFKGDSFGVRALPGSDTCAVTLAAENEKADVFFKFEQRVDAQSKWMMVLVVENRTDRTLTVDALMTVPGEKKVFKTKTLPVKPNMTNHEAWPHPIVQLVLRAFRLR